MADPILRLLNKDDYLKSMELSSFAFQYPLSIEDLDERQKKFLGSNECRIGVFQDDQLCAQATLLHLQTYINGVSYKMGGIAGVSTWPEYRRNGYVSQIIRQLLIDMRSNKQSISMLHPFSFSFYRKFGWETYVEYKKYEMEVEHLPSIIKRYKHEQLGTVHRTNNLESLKPVYNQFAIQFNGMLNRNDHWWKHRISDGKKGQYAYYKNNNNEIDGYIIYEVLNKEMTIHEMIVLNGEAERALLLYIAQHDSMVQKVTWTAPANDQITFGLDNPRIKQEIIPYFMARIIDVVSFIENYRFQAAEFEEKFIINVTDEYADWNDAIFELCISSEGTATITKQQSKEQSDLVINITIQGLTAWLLGYQKQDILRRFNTLKGSIKDIKRLQHRIGEHMTYLTDFF